jgi:WD40 repeat protein/Flp pilus assembly protein TadD
MKQPSEQTRADTDRSGDPDVTLAQDSAEAERARRHAVGPVPFPQVPGYEIERELGRGGMGVVFLARETALGRTVALKMILHGDYVSEDDLRRFRAEAEAVARLRHPHVVQIHTIGEHQGLPFLSLEYCARGSLRDGLAGKPLPPAEAARLVEALAGAVQAAHLKQIVHRDLKPHNVLLTEEGEPKITDFGLAKRIQAAEEGAAPKRREASLTRTGAVVGTPNYMPPEQARGEPVGPAADIYGLGAVLYELLTGQPPFTADSIVDTLSKVMHVEPLSPRRLRPEVPRDLETICLRCLEKEPGRRYTTAAALAEDLHRFIAGEPILARPVGRVERALKWARRNQARAAALALGLAVTVLALVGGTIAWLWVESVAARRAAEDSETRLAGALAQEQQAKKDLEQAKKDLERSLVAAQQARAETEKAREQVKRLLYADRLQLAWKEYAADRWPVARLLLDRCDAEQRLWEWKHLHGIVDRQLLSLAVHPDGVDDVAFSPDGLRLAAAGRAGGPKVWDAQTGKEQAAFPGPAAVRCLAFSPDGKSVAFAEDKTVLLWQPGAAPVPLGQHEGPVTHLTFSPDGGRLASAGEDHAVKLWDVAKGKLHADLAGHTERVNRVAFSPDGAALVSVGDGGAVKVWDARKGALRKNLAGPTDRVTEAAFSPDGRRLAAAGEDRVVRLWDAITFTEVGALRGHAAKVSGLAFSPDSLLLASGGWDGEVRLWRADNGAPQATLKGHVDRVTGVVFGPDGQWLASCGGDGTVRLWAADGRPVAVLSGHQGPVHAVAISPDGQRLASCGRDGTVRVWDAFTGGEQVTLHGNKGMTPRAFLAADGRLLLASGRTVSVFHGATGETMRTLPGHSDAVLHAVLSRDGRRLASAGDDEKIRLWDGITYKQLQALAGHAGRVSGLAFSPDGRRLASCGWDKQVKLWDAASGQLLATGSHGGRVNHLLFNPGADRLATCGDDGVIRLWDARTGKALAAEELTTPLVRLAFSPDGKRVAAVGEDGSVHVWEPGAGHTQSFAGHGKAGRHIAFSPRAPYLASCGDDGVIRLWDAGDLKKPLAQLKGHVGAVLYVAFDPDGERLVSCGEDRTVRLWDGVTGAELATLTGHGAPVVQAEFSGDGKRLVTVDREATVKLWFSDLDPKTAEARRQLAASRTAAAFEQKRQWFAAAFHLGELLKRAPLDNGLLIRRGRARAELGQWGPAAEDFGAAAERDRADADASFGLGMALLADGKRAGYGAVCRRLLKDFADADDPDAVNLAAWLGCIVPGVVEDPKELVRLAARAADARPTQWAFVDTLGVAHYRAGQYKQAQAALARALELHPSGGDVSTKFFYAMACQRLGDEDKAKAWLLDAQEQMDREAAPTYKDPPWWTDRVLRGLVRREAEGWIKGDMH